MNTAAEILAPAGNFECAIAAAEAGADAVYFGLADFNARRRAQNIKLAQLSELVNELHSRKTKAYLAMNTDISQRELAEAARYFKFAKIAGIDALIVKDLCFFEFRKYIGELEFHLSTQCGISSSAGAKFAKELGAKRIILARELNREEIKASAEINGIEVEIFVQGAMCFSISGHCLLSSWIGGRSGNRGLCASPCRMEWTNLKTAEAGRLMSMKDLSLLKHLKEISKLGVLSLKIEGRLKNAEWVANAVKTVKKFRDEEFHEDDFPSKLGNYAGRKLTDSFYLGTKKNLTADSARPKGEVSGIDKIGAKIESVLSKSKKPSRELVKIELPQELIAKIKNRGGICEFRSGKYGFSLARISSEQVSLFKNRNVDFRFIVQCKNSDDAKFAKSMLGINFIAALPSVFYENDIAQVKSIISFCEEEGIQIEVNNLDTLSLFDKKSASWSAGPGLAVINSFAANLLKSMGARHVTASLEADKTKLEELLSASPLPLLVYLFGRPVLMQSRAKISDERIRISERRGLLLNLVNDGEFTIVYPEKAFRKEISSSANAIFAIDLVYSPCPLDEIRLWRKNSAEDFNFSARLR